MPPPSPSVPARRRHALVRALLLAPLCAFGAYPLLILVAGQRPWLSLAPDEVLLVWTHPGGRARLIETPGLHLFWPLFEVPERFDKAARRLRMEGQGWLRVDHQPFLSVRSMDGSEFWFEDLDLYYQIDPARLAQHPRSNDRDREANFVAYSARAILGEEFGRLSVQESVDPVRLEAAKGAAIGRMDDFVEPFGLRVTQILTAKPLFDRQYEKAVGDRKLLEQEALGLVQEVNQIETSRAQAIQAAELAGERSLSEQASELGRSQLEVDTAILENVSKAELLAIAREGQARSIRVQRLAEAEAERSAGAQSVAGLVAQIEALAEHGNLRARQVLIEALAKVPLEIEPAPGSPTPPR